MASIRTTFTLDEALAQRARELHINISEAARRGISEAVRAALAASDCELYRRFPEEPDLDWDAKEAWGDV